MVDIVPRSKGASPQQTICRYLLQVQPIEWGNRDDRDMGSVLDVKRRIYALENLELPLVAEPPFEPHTNAKPSVFEQLPEERVLLRTEHFFVIEDGFRRRARPPARHLQASYHWKLRMKSPNVLILDQLFGGLEATSRASDVKEAEGLSPN